MTKKKIIVAIDSSCEAESAAILSKLDPELCMVKIGSVAFNSLGNDLIEFVNSKGFQIFLDLKFHDIPNTVKESILGIKSLPIEMLTIHTSGGLDMMRAAMEAVEGTTIKIFGVTVLTSLTNDDVKHIFQRDVSDQVNTMLDLAEQAGIDGVVCSPHELPLVKARNCFLSITPGIRLQHSEDDQSRVMTPSQAIELGADYLVIGRPITGAQDISSSLVNIHQSINA
jgi:orotidine-5'-phosphate decarboxylase